MVYMNGATTEPCAIINNPPINSITIMMGASQSFLRERKKDHSSFINSIINFILKLLLEISLGR